MSAPRAKPASFLTADAAERMRRHVEASIETKRKLLETGVETMLEAAEAMRGSLASGGKILICGNGGSASDAQHIAAELVVVLSQEFQRPGLAAIALTTDSSILTASGNDFGFARIFERQVQALGRAGDTLIGISTSGNSENVLRAIAYARSHNMRTIGMTGAISGAGVCKISGAAEIVLRAPSSATRFIQETHIMMGHILCELVERSLDYPIDGHAAGPNP